MENDVKTLIDAVSSGQALAISAAAIMLVTNFLKSSAAGHLVAKIPARWRIAVPIALGGVAGILNSILGGAPVAESIYLGLISGPTAVFLHESVVEAILGYSKSRKRGD